MRSDETYRSITAQVVSTGGVLATGYAAVLGVAISRQSWGLVAVAAVVLLLVWMLFTRWQWYVKTTLSIAIELENKGGLAEALIAHMCRPGTDGWKYKRALVVYMPLVGAAATLLFAFDRRPVESVGVRGFGQLT